MTPKGTCCCFLLLGIIVAFLTHTAYSVNCPDTPTTRHLSFEVKCYETEVVYRYHWTGKAGILSILIPQCSCYSNGTTLRRLESAHSEGLDGNPVKILPNNDTFLIKGVHFPQEPGAFCNCTMCVYTNEGLQSFQTLAQPVTCRLEEEVSSSVITNQATETLLQPTVTFTASGTDANMPSIADDAPFLLSSRDLQESFLLATLSSFQEPLRTQTSDSSVVALTTSSAREEASRRPQKTTDRDETSATGISVSIGASVMISSTGAAGSARATTDGGISSKAAHASSSKSHQNEITQTPKGHNPLGDDLSVTYTLIVVMLIIMMFSVIALVLSCMSIRKRKKTRHTIRNMSTGEIIAFDDFPEEPGHIPSLSMYKDDNESIITILHPLDTTTILNKHDISYDEDTTNNNKLTNGTDGAIKQEGGAARYMTTCEIHVHRMLQLRGDGEEEEEEDEDDNKRLTRSEQDLELGDPKGILNNPSPRLHKSKSLSVLHNPHKDKNRYESNSTLSQVESVQSDDSYVREADQPPNRGETGPRRHGNNLVASGSRTKAATIKRSCSTPQTSQPGQGANELMTTTSLNNGKRKGEEGSLIVDPVTPGGHTEYITNERSGGNVSVPVATETRNYGMASQSSGNKNNNNKSSNNNNNKLHVYVQYDAKHAHLIPLKSVSSCDSGYLEPPPSSSSSSSVTTPPGPGVVGMDTRCFHFEDEYDLMSRDKDHDDSFESTVDGYLQEEWSDKIISDNNAINYIDLKQY